MSAFCITKSTAASTCITAKAFRPKNEAVLGKAALQKVAGCNSQRLAHRPTHLSPLPKPDAGDCCALSKEGDRKDPTLPQPVEWIADIHAVVGTALYSTQTLGS